MAVTCNPCNNSVCLKCFDSTNKCTSCHSSRILNKTTFDCTPKDFFYENNLPEAGNCIPNCLDCQNSTGCTLCSPNLTYDIGSNACQLCSDHIENCLDCSSLTVCT